MTLDAQLRSQVEQATGRSCAQAPITKLKGDASNRSYFRVGHGADAHVVMVMPQGELTRSEEATSGAAPTELPFVNVHRYLKQLGIRVPEILRFDEPAGMMVLEDLSDETFERALGGGDRRGLYTRAVELLAHLRAQAEKASDPTCLAYTRGFDEQLYDWELHHFREWGLEIWSGQKLGAEERNVLDTEFKRIAARLAALPRGFTHRDYQSRNLMLKNGEIVVIDFQDALLGPRQYDLVALLRDSYVELPSEFVGEMLDVYRAAFAKETGETIDGADFKRGFDLLTVQRKLKDAGRFEYINRVKGNPGFLVSIPASLRYVKAALDVQPELATLRGLIAKYVPELA
jgi:aminoglycoside/choline kinase family phosphotransferase